MEPFSGSSKQITQRCTIKCALYQSVHCTGHVFTTTHIESNFKKNNKKKIGKIVNPLYLKKSSPHAFF